MIEIILDRVRHWKLRREFFSAFSTFSEHQQLIKYKKLFQNKHQVAKTAELKELPTPKTLTKIFENSLPIKSNPRLFLAAHG